MAFVISLFFFLRAGDSKNKMQGSGGALLADGSTEGTPYYNESPNPDQNARICIPDSGFFFVSGR